MDNTTNQYQGYLFETIGYKSESDLRNLIDNLEIHQAIFFVNKCLEYSHSKGIFNLIESEIISKSLSILNSKVILNNSEESK